MLIYGMVPALPDEIWKCFSAEKSTAQMRLLKGCMRNSKPERKSLYPQFLFEQLENFGEDLSSKFHSMNEEGELIDSTLMNDLELPKRGRGRPVSF